MPAGRPRGWGGGSGNERGAARTVTVEGRTVAASVDSVYAGLRQG